MNSLRILSAFLLIISTSLASDSNFRCGEDWIAFNDEKCYKVVNKRLTKDEAISACSGVKRTSHLSSIVTIKSKSEQTFIERYVFERLGIDENIWIGAKRDNTDNRSVAFEWEDGSRIHYHNWDKSRPSSDSDNECVQMSAQNAKWIDVSCSRTGIAICEKLQVWTFPEFLDNYYEWRRHIEHENQELIELLLTKDIRINKLEQSLEETNRRLSFLGSEFDRFSTEFGKRFNTTVESLVAQNKKSEKRVSDLEEKTDNLVDGMLELHDECSNGCSGNSGGPSDSQLENMKKEIIKEIEEKLDPIEDQMKETVTDARLQIISYRRTLQIKKRGQWISLGHV